MIYMRTKHKVDISLMSSVKSISIKNEIKSIV